MRVIEICAGGGGQALGLEMAGFEHGALVEIDPAACTTLRLNRPQWNVIDCDVHNFSGVSYRGADLLAGGVPCPPFSVAGKQLGCEDERDLFPEALRLVGEIQPKAVLLENVRGLAGSKFSEYRRTILGKLKELGYQADWRMMNASDFGVPQLRPRFILVALKSEYTNGFAWPDPVGSPPTVGEAVRDLMASGGGAGAAQWAREAATISPTIVGGSKKHGGPDLGPTRSRLQWQKLRVDARSIANTPPASEFPLEGHPRLTLSMAARLQGFPDTWRFAGKKTAVYRQIGNAFPPPMAFFIGKALWYAIKEE